MIPTFYHCVLLAVLCVFLHVPAAKGGGLWLYEGGSPDLGTAGAGRAALASDASTAGMTRLDRSQMLTAVQGLYIDSQFDTELSGFGGGDGGNAGGFVPSGGLHYVHRVSDDLRLGISAGSYFGLGADYVDDWAGRYYTTKAELLTFGVNPGAGYRVNNWLSVGAGVSVLYATLDQKAAVNNSAVPGQTGLADGKLELDADDVGYGFNLGMLVSPWSGTRFGLTYRSEVDLKFEDAATLKNIGPVLQGSAQRIGAGRQRGGHRDDRPAGGDAQRLPAADGSLGHHGQYRLAGLERVRQAGANAELVHRNLVHQGSGLRRHLALRSGRTVPLCRTLAVVGGSGLRHFACG